jgi:DNA-binding transcriptional LysR family regulator
MGRPYLDWDKLKAFYTVAQVGNISAASEKIHLSQSAVSRQIAALEHQLSTLLFIRHKKGVKLTTKGKVLFDAVEKVSRELGAARDIILEWDTSYKGDFHVLSMTGFAASYLSPHIPGFLKKYPDMHFFLVANDDLSSFDIREMDLIIHPKIAEDPELVQEHLFTAKLKLFAHPSYLKAKGTPKTIADLDHHNLIAYGDYMAHPLPNLNWHLTVGLPSNQTRAPYTTINFASGRLHVAEEGLGIVTVPHNHPQLKKMNLVEVLPEVSGPSIEIYLIYSKEKENALKVQAFRTYLYKIFKG